MTSRLFLDKDGKLLLITDADQPVKQMPKGTDKVIETSDQELIRSYFKPKQPMPWPKVTPDLSPRNLRKVDYGSIGEQLDLLFHDIEAGKFGNKAKDSGFANYIRSIKERHPK